ncbi:MAG TPA: DUF6701 domain-containing protein, partial [Pseudomonadales bacterium]|nr:DUF6701 domain-containing protein [Pseudomonadales bacterium]
MRLGFNAYAAASATFSRNGRQFFGVMDEVRFYNSALTSTQLGLAAQQTHACPTYGPSGFSIAVGAGSASTCQPRSVTITALNSSGAALTGYTGTIGITTSTNHGNWTRSTANGTLTQAVADSGAATYVFSAADNGSIVLNFSNTHADTLTIRVNDATYGVTATSAALTFSNNTFVLTPTAPSTASPPDVIAGRPQQFRVEMWTSGSGTCGIASGYSGNKALKAWATVDAAAPSAAVLPTVNSVNTAALTASLPSSNNLTVNFSNGAGVISVLGADVGKLSINLRDDSRTYATSSDINGGSSTFVIRPFGFDISGVNTASDANGAVFRAAGAAFSLALRAVQYDAADDDGTGNPSATADLSNNATVAHFGNETAAETVDVTPTNLLPAGGNTGVLSVSRFANFSNGSRTQ